MKRTPIRKISPKLSRQRYNESKLRQECLERCLGLCESCGKIPDWRGLSLSHTNPKKMGGTSHVYTADEVQLLCMKCHSLKHGIHEKG